MRKNFHLITISVIGLAALMTLSPVFSAIITGDKDVKIIGDERFNANTLVFSSFRFSPGSIHVNNGDVVTFENLVTMDPHTISIVRVSDLPTNITQVFQCGAPGTVCGAILQAHIPNGLGPNGPNPPVFFFVTVPGNPSGFAQGNVQGNSILILPGQTVDVTISAESGSVLHYMCAIHAWMQGEIDVK